MGYLNEDGLATLVGKVKGQVVQLTSAEYRLLPESKNSDNKIYFVTDEDYAYAIDNEPTANSDNLVKSGGVYTYTSKIGSGTLTTTAQTIIPAINELKSGLNNIKMVPFSATVSVPAGSSSEPSSLSISFANVAPSGYSIYGIACKLGNYSLPYISGSSRTWINSLSSSSNLLTISNTATSWTNYLFNAVLFFVKN